MAFFHSILFPFLLPFSSSRRTLVRLRGENDKFCSKSPRPQRAHTVRTARHNNRSRGVYFGMTEKEKGEQQKNTAVRCFFVSEVPDTRRVPSRAGAGESNRLCGGTGQGHTSYLFLFIFVVLLVLGLKAYGFLPFYSISFSFAVLFLSTYACTPSGRERQILLKIPSPSARAHRAHGTP